MKDDIGQRENRMTNDPRQVLIRRIEKIHAEMQKFCLESGITKERYQLTFEGLEELSFESLTGELEFLTKYREGTYEEAYRFKSQKSDEWWTNLVVIFNNRNLPEQLILRDHFAKMRREWRHHYIITKYRTKKPEATS